MAQRDPLVVAEHVAAVFAETAVQRDRTGGTALKERAILRESGLLGLVVPPELGGWGAAWPEVYGAVRRIARADAALAHLFGFQHLLLATVRLFGTPEQWRPLYEQTAKRAWFWGNALNPLDRRTTIVERAPGEYTITGSKGFCSGASDSDMLIVSASPPGETRLIVAAIPSSREGLRINADWDNMGQRQTDSGSVDFDEVRVFEREILKTPGPLGSPFASLRPCIAQLVLANVYLGIAEGAFAAARAFTKSSARPWFGSGVESVGEDPYVLRNYGELYVELEAAQLLTDRAAERLDAAWRLEDAVTPEQRGAAAVAIATAKVKTTRVALDVTARIFETMGARSTQAKLGFDRFWRNARTHTLHDPVDYKLKELGVWALNGELPTPSFYS